MMHGLTNPKFIFPVY